MARFFDFRQSGKEDEDAEPKVYENTIGEIVLRIDPSLQEDEENARVFLTLSLREAKILAEEMQACVAASIKALAES